MRDLYAVQNHRSRYDRSYAKSLGIPLPVQEISVCDPLSKIAIIRNSDCKLKLEEKNYSFVDFFVGTKG